ncbi:MAG: hypothetical protein ACTS7E_04000 [Arsenophonus sp. NC-CH8-MAG3]
MAVLSMLSQHGFEISLKSGCPSSPPSIIIDKLIQRITGNIDFAGISIG